MENSGWHDPQAHEQEPTDMEAGISIKNLTKIYDQVKYHNICCYMVYTCALYVNLYNILSYTPSAIPYLLYSVSECAFVLYFAWSE